MVVRILVRGDKPVMLVVLHDQSVIGIEGEEHGGYSADQMIYFSVFRNRAVHGIVGRDEKPGVEMGLQKYKQVGQWTAEVNGPI